MLCRLTGWVPWTDSVGYLLRDGTRAGITITLQHFSSYEEARFQRETLNRMTGLPGTWLENIVIEAELRYNVAKTVCTLF